MVTVTVLVLVVPRCTLPKLTVGGAPFRTDTPVPLMETGFVLQTEPSLLHSVTSNVATYAIGCGGVKVTIALQLPPRLVGVAQVPGASANGGFVAVVLTPVMR